MTDFFNSDNPPEPDQIDMMDGVELQEALRGTLAQCDRLRELCGVYKQFYDAWNRCESTRGCYACAKPHDCRCEKERHISDKCTCGRDELETLETKIDEFE